MAQMENAIVINTQSMESKREKVPSFYMYNDDANG